MDCWGQGGPSPQRAGSGFCNRMPQTGLNQQTFTPPGPEAGSEVRVPAGSSSPASSPGMGEGLSGSLYKDSDSITRAAPSQPHHLPGALPPHTMMWGLRCHPMNLGDTHVPSAAPGICPLVAEQGGRGPVASAPLGPQATQRSNQVLPTRTALSGQNL